MRDEITSNEQTQRDERKERLRRRLKAGIFTALLALSWATTQASAAQAAPAPKAGLEARVQVVRDALAAPEAAGVSVGIPAQPWFNIWWNNWGNGGWNNWHNNWNNWNNAWNNWNNWHNIWSNV